MLLFEQRTPSAAEAPVGAQPIPIDGLKSLCGLLLERARRTPDTPAYTYFDKTLGGWSTRRWAEAQALVGRWQAALAAEGLEPGERVAIMSSNRPEWAYFDLAALGLGLVTVPLFPNDRPESVRHLLEDSGARLLLIETGAIAAELDPIASTLDGLQRVLVLEPGEAAPAARVTPVASWLPDLAGVPKDLVEDPETLATVVYTSGTTGTAKGVMLTHRNLLWNAAASLKRVPARGEDRFLSFLPLSHTLERTAGYYVPLMAGAEVVYARSIPQLAEDMQEQRPTVMIAVPRIFERVYAKVRDKLDQGPALSRRLFERAVAAGWARFEHRQGRAPWTPLAQSAALLDPLVGRKIRERLGGRLRVAVCGGAPIAPEIARTFVALGVPLVPGYGLTETSPVISVNTLEDNIPESAGLPLPDVELRIADRDELLVRSPGVMRGYWKQPEATAATIDPEGWLHTGDRAKLEHGHLFITGRLKEILVLATGEKASPADLEGAILADSLFAQVLILGEGRPYLAALVVLEPAGYAALAAKEGLPDDLEAARRHPGLEPILLERIDRRLNALPGYEKIRRLAVVDGPWTVEDGFLTPTLKLKRSRVLARFRSEAEALYTGHR